MDNPKSYKVHCECGAVELVLQGEPIVHAICHCSDCRNLLNVPFHAVTAWNEDDAVIMKGEKNLCVYAHPTLTMSRFFCRNCGDTVFNTNAMNWRVVSQLLISRCNDDKIPGELSSDKHFFYEERVMDIEDDLPKYLRGTDGPLYDAHQ